MNDSLWPPAEPPAGKPTLVTTCLPEARFGGDASPYLPIESSPPYTTSGIT